MQDKEIEKKEEIIYGILKNNLKVISINKLPFIIGRSEKCDLCINNQSISKRHALIQFGIKEDDNQNLENTEENIILIDNSLNGTYVNGTKVVNGKKILLETGDKISFGNDKNVYIFEFMNYDHNRTVDYPNLINLDNIENNPISLVNENNYKKPEINHLNLGLDTKTIEKNISIENKNSYTQKNLDNIIKDNNSNINNINDNQILLLNKEIFELKKEKESLKSEINNLKDIIEKNNNNYKSANSEGNFSLNNSNINLLTDDVRELGLFRRIKESLIPNYSELNFDELSNKFDEIIYEYKKKYNMEEIILNMENEFNNEISKFNNIISLQQEQKRDSLNKINYIFNKESNMDENSKYSKINKYLMDELNQLISDKETNIKIINQLKGNIIKLRTEFNLYKVNFNKETIRVVNKNKIKKKEYIDAKENIVQKNNNNILEENNMKNFIDYNFDKYKNNIVNEYNTYFKNKISNGINDINKLDDLKEEKNNDDKNDKINNDDLQRLNILFENSENNQKYNEIIKQRKMIENSCY